MAFITTNPSPFLINVPELQNVLTSATGNSNSTESLSNAIANLQTYFDTVNSQISIDTLGSFSQSAITFTSNINLSNSVIQFLGSNLLGSNTLNGPAGHLAFQVGGVEQGRFTTGGLNLNTLNGSNGYLAFQVGGAEQGRFTTGGFAVATQNSGEFVTDLSGGAVIRGPLYVSTVGLVIGDIIASGDLTANGTLYPSDRRLKTNFAEYVSPGLPTPYRFDWRSSGRPDIGVIADEVRALEPTCVREGPDGHLTVDYPRLSVLLLAEVRALKDQVAELRARLA
jgi:hypothetical protein